MVFVLVVSVAAAGVTFYRAPTAAGASDEQAAEVFADVKTALIGYAARQGVFQCADATDAVACPAELAASSKLGEFPCPDIDNDGLAEASCASQRLGRVPWRTLGITEPRDAAGETLWYAVSRRFLNNASNPITRSGGYTNSGAINSSTTGDLTVLAADGSTITTNAVAVILSPGGVTRTQDRNAAATAGCAAASGVSRHLCAENYLETLGSGKNAAAAGPFIAGRPGADFNDRLVHISTAEVIPVLEMRLANELRGLLLEYKYNAKCFCYPWADSWAYSGGIADVGVNRGRFPSTAEPENWGTGTIPRFPAWLKDNDWHNQIYYTASKQETDVDDGGCLTCSNDPLLTVKRTPAASSPAESAAVVLVTPGTPRPGVQRPFLPSAAIANTPAANVFASFFEDPLNDKTDCPGNATEHASSRSQFAKRSAASACDTLVLPQSRAYDRDRLWTLPPETSATTCPRAGAALVKNTPCKDDSPDKVKDVCTNLVAKLQQCSVSCASAAEAMLVVPCRNNRSSSHCPGPHAALLSCTPA